MNGKLSQAFTVIIFWSSARVFGAWRQRSARSCEADGALNSFPPPTRQQPPPAGQPTELKAFSQRKLLLYLLLADVLFGGLLLVASFPVSELLCARRRQILAWTVASALMTLLYIQFWSSMKKHRQEKIAKPLPSSTSLGQSGPQDMTGTWLKDHAASESMAEAIRIANLSRLTRTAVRLIKGVQIRQSQETFEFAVFSVIGWFKVREVYPMNGQPSQEKRRDLRKGRHVGQVQVTGEGYIRLHLKWGDPFAGAGFDEFRLVSRDILHVVSRIEVNGSIAGYKTVYRLK